MKRNEEDEIQVLGTPVQARGRRRFARFGVWAACVMVLAGGLLLRLLRDPEEERAEEPEVVLTAGGSAEAAPSVVLTVDSINDVKMRIYALQGLSAALSFELPETADTTVFLVVPAADVRRDNGGIVGDFLLRGERLARGKRKKGYCALLEGQVSIGRSADDEMLERCVRQKGDFFRQYPLVIEGEIQENRLKGKALRRALARLGEHLCLVESCNRESVYDFSEALADFGFSDALYLVGGNSYGWWRSESGAVHELCPKEASASYPNLNYLLFRSTDPR